MLIVGWFGVGMQLRFRFRDGHAENFPRRQWVERFAGLGGGKSQRYRVFHGLLTLQRDLSKDILIDTNEWGALMTFIATSIEKDLKINISRHLLMSMARKFFASL